MKNRNLYFLILFLIIIADMYCADDSMSKKAIISAATLGSVGIVITPAMAALNKVVGHQDWPTALKSAAKGAVPFALTLAGAGAVQTIITQHMKKIVINDDWKTNLANQIPGGMLAGYISGVAELSLIHSLHTLAEHPQGKHLLITGGYGAPAAVIRDMIFFVGMHGNGQLKAKLDEMNPEYAYANPVISTVASASAATWLSQPYAIIKTEQQLNCLNKKLTMSDIIRRDGLLKLSTKGLIPRGIAVALIFGTMGPIQQVVTQQINQLSK